MKKVMFLSVMVGLLVFSVVTSAFASTAYLDYTVGGNTKVESFSSNNDDLSQYLVGVEVPLDKFKVGLEYANDTIKFSGNDLKCTDIKLKGGYQLIKNDIFELYGDLSYLSKAGDSNFSNIKYSPILIGVDGKYVINEKMFISGNLDFAVSGKTSADSSFLSSDTDTDYTAVKVKYTYLFNEKIGAMVGYEWSNWNIKAPTATKLTDTGFTLGVTYNF
jgi:Outer membrane protein beta-barrel domain